MIEILALHEITSIETLTDEVASYIEQAVYERIGDLPKQIARKATETLIAELTK